MKRRKTCWAILKKYKRMLRTQQVFCRNAGVVVNGDGVISTPEILTQQQARISGELQSLIQVVRVLEWVLKGEAED